MKPPLLTTHAPMLLLLVHEFFINLSNAFILPTAPCSQYLLPSVSSTRLWAVPAPEEMEQLQADLESQAAVVAGLMEAMNGLTALLEVKDLELQQQQDSWGQEKTGLVAKIAEFTSTLQKAQKNNDETEMRLVEDEELSQERARLEREIKLLQNQLEQVEARYEVEKDTNDKLAARLNQVNDALEYEQMMFYKQKSQLKESVKQQQGQLAEVERKLASESASFGSDQATLEEQLKLERQRLAEVQRELEQTRKDYRETQAALSEQLRFEDRAVKAVQQALLQQQSDNQVEREDLQRQLEKEQKSLAKVEETLRKEQEYYNKMQPFLEEMIQEERAKVQKLEQKLEKEQVRFQFETKYLEDRIAAEKQRLEQVQEQLSKERLSFDQQRQKYVYEASLIEEEKRIDRSRMNKRFGALRQALTERYYAEKRKGKKNVKTLNDKYADQMVLVGDAISQIQGQLKVAGSARELVKGMVQDLTVEVKVAEQANLTMERRYKGLLNDRAAEITSLRSNIQRMQDTAVEREKEIQQVESSYREISKYTVALSKRRLGRLIPFWHPRNGKEDA